MARGPVIRRVESLFDLGADSLSTIEARLELEAHGFVLPENWEWMAVSKLALHRKDADAGQKQTGWFLPARRLDTFIVMRSIAIALIVAQHEGWEMVVGASLVLFALAGYTFGRLHLPAILEDGRTGRVWALIAKLLVPLVPASILIFMVHSEIGNSPHPATVLLYENVAQFIDLVILGINTEHRHLVWLWFLHTYLQIFFLLAVLLAIPRVRAALASNPWRGALVFYGMAEIIGAGLILLLSGPLDLGKIEWISELLQHAPTTLLPVFALGVLFAYADSLQRRIIAILLGIAHFALAQVVYVEMTEITWLLALGLCIFVPFVTIPRILAAVLVIVSGHALMIYLSHRAVDFALSQFVPGLLPTPVEICAQLAIGVLLGVALRPVLDGLGINRLAQKRISFGAGSRVQRTDGA